MTIQSTYLQEERRLSILLPHASCIQDTYPVVFCADGHDILNMIPVIASGMRTGDVPPVVVVGVHCNVETRAEDYVAGIDSSRFAAHEKFFTTEVFEWVEADLGFTPTRSNCGLFGFSNGGALVIHLSLRHREKFGVVIAFSVSRSPEKIENSEYIREPRPRYYLAAGVQERLFKKNTLRIAKALAKHGIEHLYVERDAGHNY
ncbi:MAG: hypothetical protein JW829_02770, partial [Pirellulales bacterium]|nr:hypothetical protein [Pirellulales bacterium]